MKFNLIFLYLLLAFSCSNNKNMLHGNWYFNKEYNYIEVHFKDTLFEYSTDLIPLGDPYQYKIIKDTFFSKSVLTGIDDTLLIVKLDTFLVLINNNNNNNADTIFLNRLNEKIEFGQDILRLNSEEKESEYFSKFLKRKEKYSQEKESPMKFLDKPQMLEIEQ